MHPEDLLHLAMQQQRADRDDADRRRRLPRRARPPGRMRQRSAAMLLRAADRLDGRPSPAPARRA